jgi:hypothetical protein
MAGKEKDARYERYLSAFLAAWQLHKNGEPKEILIEIYYKIFENTPIEEIEKAFGYAVNNLQWFPKPVELRSFIQHGPGDIEDIAYTEADKVVNAVKRVGYYDSVTFDDPVTMAVIAQGWGGWMKLCETLRDDEVKWFRKDFVRIYKAYSNQEIKQYGHLVGFHEDRNQIGYPEHVPEPIMIGDNEKARKVLEHHKKPGLKLLK